MSTIEITRLGIPLNDNEILDLAMAGVEVRFKERGNHSPSKDHMQGLRQIAKAIEAMACGVHENPNKSEYPHFDRSFCISFLPPGMGKTTTLVETIKVICSQPKYNHVGFIIFLERYEEIENIVRDIGIAEVDYSVITSNAEMNKLGNADTKKARVLFTTQAMLRHRAGKASVKFEEMKDFYYRGKPRQVRVWDEAVLPFLALTLEERNISALRRGFFKISPELEAEIKQFVNVLEGKKDGERVLMPDINKYALELEEVKLRFNDEDKNNIEALWGLSGMEARVSKDKFGTTTLQYVDILPDDLAPLLILDASGQQRKTYEYWYKERKGLRFLHSPQKSYKGFSIHHWDVGAGIQSQSKGNYAVVAEGVARAINNDVPKDEDVLVIHYKQSPFMPDMEEEINNRLGYRDAKVFYRHWGTHTATNDYSHIKYIFLAGILQYNSAQYETYGLGAKGQDIHTPLTKEEFEEVRFGEIAHHILQASCRGHVRKSVGSGCPEGCHLYIIFSTNQQTGTPTDLLTRIFPDATVDLDWCPVVRLQGKRMNMLATELERLLKKGETQVNKTKLQKRLELSSHQQLNKMLRHPDFLEHMKTDKKVFVQIRDGEIFLEHTVFDPIF